MREISQWLETLGLGQYAEVFSENEIDLLVLPELTEDDLKELHLPMGHRKKLLKAIATLSPPGEEAPPEVAPQTALPAHSVTLHLSPPTPSSRPAGAERRQLTVEFCDLVGSTPLSGQLDPEDLRSVVRAYQEAAAEVIYRYEGHIAQYLGDGLLIYCGYPQAHEDNAHRAIRIGLGIVEAIEHLNPSLEEQYGVRLAVRVGIHTGLVVVGEMGGGGRHENLATGETVNIASRLEGLAAANQVVISVDTRRLVGGAFDLEDLGTHAMQGVAEPMQIYGIRGERAVDSRFDAATVTGLTPLVGREEEVGLLMRRWEQAKAGKGQVVLLCGEPGIGKSRLIETVGEVVTQEPHIRLRYQCSPYHINSAFYPIITQLERAAQFTRNDTPDQKLTKLEGRLGQGSEQVTEVAALVAALLAIPSGDRYPPLTLTPQRQKERTIEMLVEQSVGLARHQPILLIFEDAHWSDPTSLEVLDLLIHRVAEVRMLVVITYRPEFEPSWGEVAHVTTHPLNRLTRRQVATLVAGGTGGKSLPDEVSDVIAAKTDGVPLFVEELTKMLLEAGFLRDTGEHYELMGPLPPLAIPATLQDALMARLDRLAPVKEVAQIGAALGREFSYELAAAVSPLPDPALQGALDQLVSAELLFQRGTPPAATYLFKHALVQDTAYASLLRSRRRQLHTQIAQVLETQFPETVEAQPELVARHYTEAELNESAIPYWQQAGQLAVARSVNVEAIKHLTTGLELLKTLPDTPERTQQELTLQSTLGPVFIGTKGWAAPETGEVYTRAQELCQQIGQAPQLFPALWGLYGYYGVRGEYQTARELAEQILDLAESQQNTGFLVQACFALGLILFILGELSAARKYLAQGSAVYDHQQHNSNAFLYGNHPGVSCLSFEALTLWHLGSPEQALTRSQEAVTLSQQTLHPFSVVFALDRAAAFHQFRREVQAVQERAEAGISLSNEQGFPLWVAAGTILRGWALAEQGHIDKGIAQIRHGLSGYRATGAEMFRPHFLALLAEAYGKGGRAEEGLNAVAEALDIAHETGERFYEAELYRLKGELLANDAWGTSLPHGAEAAGCFQHAIEVAQQQSAKSLELRASVSLARLWQQQGKITEARQRLAEIYGWFTEGFDTADLQEAQHLLDELSEEVRTPTT